MTRPPLFTALALLAIQAPAPAVDPVNEGTLTLVNEPGSNELSIGLNIDTIGSDSDTSTITGSLLARLDIDPTTGRSPEFTILGGTIQGSPINLKIQVTVFIFKVTVLDVGSSVIGGTLFTTTPPGLIDPATGQGDAAQHEFEINEGAVTGTATNPLTSETTPIAIDFAADPVSGPGSGTVTVTITPAGTTSTRGLFDVVLLLPASISETVPNDLGLTATFSASGTFKAAGQVSVPLSDYLAWTETQGIPGADPETDSNGNGIDNGITWALGLGNADNPRPHLPMPDPAVPRGFLLPLPATGTAGPLTVEVSPDLSPGSWTAANPADLSTGTNPLPAGTAGNVTLLPGSAPQRYLRLLANP